MSPHKFSLKLTLLAMWKRDLSLITNWSLIYNIPQETEYKLGILIKWEFRVCGINFIPLGNQPGIWRSSGTQPEFDIPQEPNTEFDIPQEPHPEYDIPQEPNPEFDIPQEPNPEFDVPQEPNPKFDIPQESNPEFGSTPDSCLLLGCRFRGSNRLLQSVADTYNV